MYKRYHGKETIKDTTPGAKPLVKRAASKARRNTDKREEQRPCCPYCADDTCGGWCA